MNANEISVGDILFAVARDGGPWHVVRLYAGNEAWIGEGFNRLWPCSDAGIPDAGFHFAGPLTDVFRTRAEAQLLCDQRQAAYESGRQRRLADEAAATERRRNLEKLHDRLYGEAMQLAADEDDMDVVEHYCQGSVTRLREFISARTH